MIHTARGVEGDFICVANGGCLMCHWDSFKWTNKHHQEDGREGGGGDATMDKKLFPLTLYDGSLSAPPVDGD